MTWHIETLFADGNWYTWAKPDDGDFARRETARLKRLIGARKVRLSLL